MSMTIPKYKTHRIGGYDNTLVMKQIRLLVNTNLYYNTSLTYNGMFWRLIITTPYMKYNDILLSNELMKELANTSPGRIHRELVNEIESCIRR